MPDLPQQTGAVSELRGAVGDTLQLEVVVNGRSTHAIIEVERGADGVLSVRRRELQGAGLKPPDGSPEALVPLDAIPGLAYNYDQSSQTLRIEAPDALIAPHVLSPVRSEEPTTRASSAIGAALDYDAFASAAAASFGRRWTYGGASLTLDGRLFSPWGVFTQSGVVGSTAGDAAPALRLDTAWQYVDEDRLVAYRVGDLVGSSLAWTRPIRMGGAQISRDFAIRPDLVTSPAPTVSGSAALPSSLDVYVNDFKVFTQNVDPGPFKIDNLPVVGGNGTATLVTHDINGKESTTTVPFFASPRLLGPSVFDYSAEAGFARTDYGVKSFSYDAHPIGAGTLRGGLTEDVTLEAHAEGGDGLLNGGAGVAARLFGRGVVEMAIAGSRFSGGRGAQFALGGSTAIGSLILDVASQRTLRSYADLAEVTSPTGPQTLGSNILQQMQSGGVFLSPLLLSTSVAPPRALDRISLGIPKALWNASINLSFVNEVQGDGQTSRIASLGLSRSFPNGAALFATAYVDFANRNDSGAFAGLSWTFDNNLIASSQAGVQGRASAITTEIDKPSDNSVGSTGWRVADSEGGDRYLAGQGSYVTPYGKATATLGQYGDPRTGAAQGSLDFQGSAAALGGAAKFAPSVPDSLALVDAGAPGVTVLEDNRVVGKTDASGRLLLTGLRGYQTNRISIDATSLPLDAAVGQTETIVRPRGRSGVLVDFKVAREGRDAELVLVDEKGSPLPPGGLVERPGREPAMLGYDGRAYLTALDPHDVVIVRTDGHACRAEFDYAQPRGAARPTIGPVVCRTVASQATVRRD